MYTVAGRLHLTLMTPTPRFSQARCQHLLDGGVKVLKAFCEHHLAASSKL